MLFMIIRRRNTLAALSAFALLGLSHSANAQTFPAKPIRIIVPYAAGANSDVLTRAVAQKVTKQGGPTFVIDNKPGGGGVIGAMAARQAAPDGYTLFVANSSTHGILPALQKLPYDFQKDFQPITQLFYFANFLIVPGPVQANSVQELVALAKTSGGLTFGSQGNGSPGHLLGAMLQQKSGAPLVHVPYAGGGGPMNIDVVAGRLDMVFSTWASLRSHQEQGKVRFLAVASAQRSPLTPNIPTMAEQGLPGVELDAWFGLVAPAGTPTAVVSSLHAMFDQAARSPDLIERFQSQGVTLATQSPAVFADQIRREAERLGQVVRASNLSAH
jgi:tripartite-type tricarboxylate transporter receptor subunit TctC